MLQYEYMQRVMLAGLMLSIMIPMLGVVMVNRRTSMVGDALSHTSLAGVGLGLILGFNPVLGAALVCVVSAFLIEGIRKKFPQYGDMATAVIMSLGLGVAAILADFAPGGNTFESYLFGSISSVSRMDLLYVLAAFIPVVVFSVFAYGGLLAIAIDPNLARLSGVRVVWVNGIFTLLSAVTIALACKVVGALMVTSLLVLPVATALIICKSYKSTYFLSVALGVIYMMSGLYLSYTFDVRPGGTIIINAVLGMLIMWLLAKVKCSPRKTKRKAGAVS